MGNNLDQLPRVGPIDFHFTKRSDFLESSDKKYYFHFFKDYQRVSPLEKQFLASQILDLFKASFLTTENFDKSMSYYLHFPNAVGVYLIFIIDKKTHKPKGFSLYTITEVYLEPNNYKEENKYLVSTGLGCINPEYRRAGIYKDLLSSSFYLVLANFPNKNYIHYDVSINPISFYMCSRSNLWFYPGPKKELNSKQMDFFKSLLELFEHPSIDRKKPYIVYDPNEMNETEKNNWLSGYSGFPEEIKFFIDETKLLKDIGIAFIAPMALIEGNTLGLPANRYLNEERPSLLIFEHAFVLPKL